jgi:uncharacterized protein YqeY
MDLRERIQKDLQEALKNSEKSRLSVLRLLRDAVTKKEKEKRAALSAIIEEEERAKKSLLTDQEVLQLIVSSIKRSKEAILQFKQGERDDLAEKEKGEIEILNQYLPEQLGEDDIKKMVIEIIKETRANSLKDMGKVMGLLMPKIQGQADGGLVSRIVKELLT